ncbi:MAG: hypothetical protein ACJ8GN_27715 [Longimicrobiaceae bacterium]
MASRAYTDSSGVEWLVWEVTPGQHTRPARRSVSALPDELAEGWLCFESGMGKRRFYPVPPEWETLADDKLEILCRAAVAVDARPSAVETG